MPVRTLNPDDAEAYRDLRLTALRESPTAFGSSEQDELNRSPAETAARLRTTENDFVLGVAEGERLLGMVGLHRFENVKERHKGIMWGMYVRPEARRAGV